MSSKCSGEKLERKASKQSHKAEAPHAYEEEEKYEFTADAKSEDSDSDCEVMEEKDFPSVQLEEGEPAIAPSRRAHEVISGFSMYVFLSLAFNFISRYGPAVIG